MKILIPLLLGLFSFETASSQEWQTEATTDRGRLQYYYNGNLGFSVRTSVGGGWAWQLVDGGNSSYFHVDYPTGKVGIGTNSPSEQLTIRGVGSIGAEIVTDGATNSRPVLGFFRGPGYWHLGMNIDVGNTDNFHFRYNGSTYPLTIQGNSGNIGIGTVSPSTRLSLGVPVQSRMISLHDDQNDWYGFGMQSYQMRFQVGNANSRFAFYAGDNSEVMTINGSGNVGIGTSSPNEKLTVNGTIYGKEVKVDLSVPGPDYVFEKDYNLPPLSEIQRYIDEHKHLPEIPSAAEMKESGIELGVMNMLLLKKIEELMLYVIELKKENEKQDVLIKELQNK